MLDQPGPLDFDQRTDNLYQYKKGERGQIQQI
jgi:hypothetical protein